MDAANTRTLISHLAEDLSWLEEHCRRQADQAAQAGKLRLAGALVRNVIGPFLEGQPHTPLHVAVVGGAGAGKSTVANLLSGAVLAEANPQAGFTRHPVAYTCGNGQITWNAHLGFLGPLRRLSTPSPASMDADVFQVRQVLPAAGAFTLLEDYVIWDCPDMTTWAATTYVPRLLEIAGLADVLVYVASDERYNDEVPTQFLKLLMEVGKPVIVCLVKMKEADATALVGHFQKEVLNKLPGGAVACLTVPHLNPDQLADPVKHAGLFRVPLLDQVSVLGKPPFLARRRSVQTASNYLKNAREQLLSVARQDLAALEAWRNIVRIGQLEFDSRYQRYFLATERSHRINPGLGRLVELLELPGAGKFVSGTLWVVRTPYRLLKGLFNKALRRPELPPIPEAPVLEGALAGWLAMLRKEAARRGDTHPVWEHLDKGFQTGLSDQAHERFLEGFRSFQMSQAEEVERTARAIYEELEKNPAALNTLRGAKFALEVAAIGAAIASGGITVMDFV